MGTLEILFYITEFIAAITATIYFYKYKNDPVLKWMLPYLWYVAINEIVGYYVVLVKGWLTYELVNIYSTITVLFMLWIVHQTVKKKKEKLVVKSLAVIFSTVFLYDLISKGLGLSWPLSDLSGSIVAVTGFCIYCVHLFSTDDKITLVRDLMTYIVLGFTIFFVASPIIILTIDIYEYNYALVLQLKNLLFIIIILMYLIFSFGFIWSEKRHS